MNEHERSALPEAVTGEESQAPQAVAVEHPGRTLAAAREAMMLTPADIGARLKISPRQIEALENGQWEAFASPTILKGFVRAYAKALQIEPEGLVAALPIAHDPATTLSLEPTLHQPMPTSTRRGALRWWLHSGVVGLIAIVVAVVIGKFGVLPLDFGRPANEAHEFPSALPANVDTAANEPAPAAGITAPEVAAAPAGPVGAETPAQGAAAATNGSVAVPAFAPEAQAPAVAPTAASGPSQAQLRINVETESWIEITDAAGRVLLSALQPAGAQQDVNGRAPFQVVVGNAPGVRIEYAGKQVDLAPYTRGNVARLAIN